MNVAGILQRVSVYSADATDTEGWVAGTYTLSGTWWGRLVVGPTRRKYTTPNGEVQADAMLYMDSRIALPTSGAFKDQDGTAWVALNARKLPLSRQWEVALVRSTDQKIVLP
jgi:hypothetical protein